MAKLLTHLLFFTGICHARRLSSPTHKAADITVRQAEGATASIYTLAAADSKGHPSGEIVAALPTQRAATLERLLLESEDCPRTGVGKRQEVGLDRMGVSLRESMYTVNLRHSVRTTKQGRPTRMACVR